jgi:hypothetical protein
MNDVSDLAIIFSNAINRATPESASFPLVMAALGLVVSGRVARLREEKGELFALAWLSLVDEASRE